MWDGFRVLRKVHDKFVAVMDELVEIFSEEKFNRGYYEELTMHQSNDNILLDNWLTNKNDVVEDPPISLDRVTDATVDDDLDNKEKPINYPIKESLPIYDAMYPLFLEVMMAFQFVDLFVLDVETKATIQIQVHIIDEKIDDPSTPQNKSTDWSWGGMTLACIINWQKLNFGGWRWRPYGKISQIRSV